ncbi:MAG: DUF427 domain-containing protein [Acidimicrobiales bacterium]
MNANTQSDGSTRAKIRIETGPKRTRTYVSGIPVADTISPLLVWEHRFYPQYYFPRTDVNTELLVSNAVTKSIPNLGVAEYFDVVVGTRTIPNAAWAFPESDITELRDAIRFEWDAMDSWFEEDEEVSVHARDPYTRLDILASNRHIQVAINGFTVADSSNARLLFETGMPTRYYLPKTDVRMDLVRTTESETHCPYKGTAETFSMEVDGTLVKNIAWSYAKPLAESQSIVGLVAFLNEKVDIYVDGVLQGQAKSIFS